MKSQALPYKKEPTITNNAGKYSDLYKAINDLDSNINKDILSYEKEEKTKKNKIQIAVEKAKVRREGEQ